MELAFGLDDKRHWRVESRLGKFLSLLPFAVFLNWMLQVLISFGALSATRIRLIEGIRAWSSAYKAGHFLSVHEMRDALAD